MGHWSVYCGISRICITAGRKCVLLPLKKSIGGRSYLPYLPATLPIFGEYDDYGGIENIERDENVELIEKHFNCTIEEFSRYFTRGCIRDNEDDFPKKLKEVEEIQNWKFMFIDREVYDFMSTHTSNGYGGKGNLDYGNPKILELLGFKYLGENPSVKISDPKRFKYEWEYEGQKFYSDGTWLIHESGNSIYTFENDYGSGLTDYITPPEDKKWVGEKTMWQLWKYLDESKLSNLIYWIIGGSSGISHVPLETLQDLLLRKISIEEYDKIVKDIPVPISTKYCENPKVFGERLSELVTIRYNLHPMSGQFEPYILFLTPQDGEFLEHQILLDKFAEIHRRMINEYGYDEDIEDIDD